MKTVKYKLGEKYPERGCALALGFFDGVHLGHRELLCRAVYTAKEKGTSSAVFTFSYGGGIKSGQAMIYSDKEREELFTSIGIDVCFVADFADLKDLSSERFVFETIVGDIGASSVFAGYNYRFGKNGAADATELSRLMTACGGEAVIFEPFTCEGRPVSSTRVRALLEGGEIEDANAMLGLPYFVRGAVEHGRGDGRGFGYPTVNISVGKERVRLKRGVYLTAVKIGEKLYTGLTNVGECPSFGKREYHTETFILDFSESVYEMEIKVYFLSFLREERVFSSSKELALQIEKDIAVAYKRKEEIKWQEIGLV